jgi:transketolase
LRTSFIKTLYEIAAEDPRVTLVVGDLGFGVVTDFAARYPNQFLNAGISEQNMTGVAAGMALAGRTVFTYSIANFPTLRCIEQIRNDVCYHGANVKIVCVGGGYAYGSLGMTHHATEDVAVMRSLPAMKIVAPGDPVETRLAVRAMVNDPSPYYLRLGRAGEPVVHREDVDFAIGRAITVRKGSDATLISTGGMLDSCIKAACMLGEEGRSVGVISMHTLKPLDLAALTKAARSNGPVLTVEEHSEIGGLGSAVAEVLMQAGFSGVFRKIALPDKFSSVAGDYQYLRALAGLDVDSIADTVRRAMRIVQIPRTAVRKRAAKKEVVRVAAIGAAG